MFTLPKLPYEYGQLEPSIDTQTMIIHHTKHHQTYVDKLNAGLTGTEYAGYTNFDLVKLVSNISNYDDSIKSLVKNHGGGHINHSIFWESLTPKKQDINNFENIKEKIYSDFIDFETFQKQFTEKALGLFGSGWTWLEFDKTNNKLQITNYPNQENPYMYGLEPILGLDLREHAYYLSNQNRRPDYISKRWNIINREYINKKISPN